LKKEKENLFTPPLGRDIMATLNKNGRAQRACLSKMTIQNKLTEENNHGKVDRMHPQFQLLQGKGRGHL
jgi:hypothetical protein